MAGVRTAATAVGSGSVAKHPAAGSLGARVAASALAADSVVHTAVAVPGLGWPAVAKRHPADSPVDERSVGAAGANIRKAAVEPMAVTDGSGMLVAVLSVPAPAAAAAIVAAASVEAEPPEPVKESQRTQGGRQPR